LFTKSVGKIEPTAFPTLLAIEAQGVASALDESENHVTASKALELRKNGCPNPAKVFPSMKNQTFSFTRTLHHIPAPVSTIPAIIWSYGNLHQLLAHIFE